MAVRGLGILLVILNIIDYVVTLYALELGAVELNPIIKTIIEYDLIFAGILKIGLSIGICILVFYKNVSPIILISLCTILMLVILNNLYVIIILR